MDGVLSQSLFSLPSPVSTPLLNLTERCLSLTIPKPTLFGAVILNITSSLATNYTAPFFAPTFYNSDPPQFGAAENLSFCNVSVRYTHPGHNDNINVNLWLPLSVSDDIYVHNNASQGKKQWTSPEWNGILLTHGGGGFSTCLPNILSHTALSQGYAISRTDGGHPPLSFSDPTQPTVESWAMLSPGNVNLYLFQDYASVALHDLAVISKDVVSSFYEMAPKYSYFQGCSTGGRQGLMLAQRYPNDYDGILAASPALYVPKLMVSNWIGQMVMNSLHQYPKPCELEAITRAAVEECDILDGAKDGIISNNVDCNFDPFPATNPKLREPVFCSTKYADKDEAVEEFVNISDAAAQIAYHLWGGAKGSPRRPDWHVPLHSSPLTEYAATTCFYENGTCVPSSHTLAADWLRVFLYRDPSLTAQDLTSRITLEELMRLYDQSEVEYHSLISTSDPNLSRFAQSGGKILVWHGTSDEVIMPGQTTQYYNSVLDYAQTQYSGIENVEDFFRLFMVPGVQHCGGGEGALPINTLRDLRRWVEEGVAPQELDSESFTRSDGDKIYRRICKYPLVARYKGEGHDIRRADSFECADTFFIY